MLCYVKQLSTEVFKNKESQSVSASNMLMLFSGIPVDNNNIWETHKGSLYTDTP